MRKVTRKALLAYLATPAGRQKFDEGFGPGRTPEDYLDEYSDRPDIVDALAQDTGFYEAQEAGK